MAIRTPKVFSTIVSQSQNAFQNVFLVLSCTSDFHKVIHTIPAIDRSDDQMYKYHMDINSMIHAEWLSIGVFGNFFCDYRVLIIIIISNSINIICLTDMSRRLGEKNVPCHYFHAYSPLPTNEQ